MFMPAVALRRTARARAMRGADAICDAVHARAYAASLLLMPRTYVSPSFYRQPRHFFR